MAAMSEPTDELDQAIKAKDIDKFHKAYVKLTAACNACHEATGFGFIKIREPRLSPSSRDLAVHRRVVRQVAVRLPTPALAPALLTGLALAFARGVGEYGSVISSPEISPTCQRSRRFSSDDAAEVLLKRLETAG